MANDTPIYIDIGKGLSLPLSNPTISHWTTIERPINPLKGTLGFNTETNFLEFWNGTTWLLAEMKEI